MGWIGYAAYAAKDLGVQDGGFPEMMNRHWGSGSYKGMYNWATTKHPGKPLMLTEWGVQEKYGSSSWKQQFFQSAAPSMKDYPALKALVYFNNYNAYKAGDVRANTSTASAASRAIVFSSWRTLPGHAEGPLFRELTFSQLSKVRARSASADRVRAAWGGGESRSSKT